MYRELDTTMKNTILIIFLFANITLWAAYRPKDDKVYKFNSGCIKILPLANDSVLSKHHLLNFKLISNNFHNISKSKDTLLICEGLNNLNIADTVLYYVIDSNSMKVDSAYIYIVSMVQKISNSVYPGDINNDGKVNFKDYFFWADRVGKKVQSRFEISDRWFPYAMPLIEWKDTTIFKTKTFLADADGDGEVALNDILPIYSNYGKSHVFGENFDYNSFTNFSYPIIPLQLKIIDEPIVKGNFLNIEVDLGDNTQPLKDISGFGFTFRAYTLVNGGINYLNVYPTMLPFDSWLKSNSILDFYFLESYDTGRFYCVETLLERKKAEGGGSTGQVRIIIDDLIIQNLSAGRDIYFELLEGLAVGSTSNQFLRTSLTSDTLFAIKSFINKQEERNNFIISNELNEIKIEKLSNNKHEILVIKLKNLLGETISEISSDETIVKMNIERKPVGCYVLQIESKNRIIYIQKIIK